ncbi:hypothetical protein JXA32_13805 [Candidatus Sumerlaeota bacterium]|nr:hypothetical protein [Candidatus Sumerlaeota bacterium]
MMDPGVLVILLLFGTPLVLIVGAFVIIGLIIMKSGSKKGTALSADEARIMQELHQGLSKLEKRIENLETIFIEQKQ